MLNANFKNVKIYSDGHFLHCAIVQKGSKIIVVNYFGKSDCTLCILKNQIPKWSGIQFFIYCIYFETNYNSVSKIIQPVKSCRPLHLFAFCQNDKKFIGDNYLNSTSN